MQAVKTEEQKLLRHLELKPRYFALDIELEIWLYSCGFQSNFGSVFLYCIPIYPIWNENVYAVPVYVGDV